MDTSVVATAEPPPAGKSGDEQAAVRRAAKAKRKRERKPKLGLSDRERLRNRVIGVTCSEPWTDHAMREADACGVHPGMSAKQVHKALKRLGIYPPPADTSGMVPCRCRNCRGIRLWPAHYVTSRGYSTECSYEHLSKSQAALLPGSTSKIDMARLRKSIRQGATYGGGL